MFDYYSLVASRQKHKSEAKAINKENKAGDFAGSFWALKISS
jgi:hypothetical protein